MRRLNPFSPQSLNVSCWPARTAQPHASNQRGRSLYSCKRDPQSLIFGSFLEKQSFQLDLHLPSHVISTCRYVTAARPFVAHILKGALKPSCQSKSVRHARSHQIPANSAPNRDRSQGTQSCVRGLRSVAEASREPA